MQGVASKAARFTFQVLLSKRNVAAEVIESAVQSTLQSSVKSTVKIARRIFITGALQIAPLAQEIIHYLGERVSAEANNYLAKAILVSGGLVGIGLVCIALRHDQRPPTTGPVIVQQQFTQIFHLPGDAQVYLKEGSLDILIEMDDIDKFDPSSFLNFKWWNKSEETIELRDDSYMKINGFKSLYEIFTILAHCKEFGSVPNPINDDWVTQQLLTMCPSLDIVATTKKEPLGTNGGSLSSFTPKVHALVLSFLSAREVLRYSQCCRTFNKIAELYYGSNMEVKVIPINRGAPMPSERALPSAVMYQNSLFVYGGAGELQLGNLPAISEYLEYNDLWAFHFKEGGKWENYTVHQILPNLKGHTAVVYKDDMYLFGGYNSQRGLSNSVHKIEIATKIAKEVGTQNCPSPRYSHTSVVYNDKMYVYGGVNELGSSSDFYELDLRTLQWKPVFVRGGESPGSCRSHCAVVHSHYMYLSSGDDIMHRFDFEMAQWEAIYKAGGRRLSADMVVYQDAIYLVGGWNIQPLADMYEFNIKTHAWIEHKTDLKKYTGGGIMQHKCVIYNHWLLVVFGNSFKHYTDMYAIPLGGKK